ncbi:hypothetical protein K7X08_031877 [Anisodus acutangulus]|uniref:beta-glucosidase n=1 Tax=Anisodus acutangulus TaxID=402998 RepID=A0A9Q1MLY1_9SOLA|nr:hypothetical protein K7X08_031877 [Anisodus acutangulus]
MIQIERKVASADVMKQYFIGSVLSGGGSVPAPKPSAEDWINMVNEIQKGALSTPLRIPMIYGIDAVHGHNNVYNATIFPHNIGLGVTRDPDLVKRIGAATALEVRATGIPYAFAPCIAVCRDPRRGRCYESYSEDHKIVRTMTEIIPGLQGDLPANARKGTPFVAGKSKVAACAKHFVGDGGTVRGIDENNTRTTEFIDALTLLVKNNVIPVSRIEDAVKRILRVKFTMGLFENPLADLSLVNQLGSQEHRELAREAVRKSLVLLKNGKSTSQPLLPLPKKAPKILVVGTHADNLGYQCGGWTIEWHGVAGNVISYFIVPALVRTSPLGPILY